MYRGKKCDTSKKNNLTNQYSSSFWNVSSNTVLQELHSKPEGLTSDEAQQRLADVVEQSHADIVLLGVSTWPVALGYAPWVEEVWANYLSNALKYGGRPPCVELGAAPLPNPPPLAEEGEGRGMVRFWVRDNGPGILPEDQARLFTPFTRLDQVRVKGHGLGLSIVKRIVEKLGGQVGVESQVGHGSTFSFTLPGTSNPRVSESVTPSLNKIPPDSI